MGRKHQSTFAAIYEKPDRKDIEWADFLVLVEYLGSVLKISGGSAVGVRLNGVYAVFHKPHPGHEIYTSDLKRIRRFLETAGIREVD
jgi:hypothetical protein